MSDRNDDKKPHSFFDTIRKKSKERLEAFMFKNEDVPDTEELEPVVEKITLPKHPLYAFWTIWQQDLNTGATDDIDVSEEAFLSWFGHDIELSVKDETEEIQEIDEIDDFDELEISEEDDFPEETKPKPIPTPAQLFTNSLTKLAEDYVREIKFDYRIAESELELKQEEYKKKIQEKSEQTNIEPDIEASENPEISQEIEEVTEETDEEPVLTMKPRDAIAKTYVSDDNMSGFIFLFPPLFGGQAATSQTIAETLLKSHIIFGIETEHVDQILPQNGYMQIHNIAHGLLPVDGTDGQIIDHIPRDGSINVVENEQGIVDFKQLNIIQNIKKDQPICTLIPPVPGTDGQNVRGKTIPCKRVIMPKAPQGTNTAISPDGTKLIATMDGFAEFRYSRFNVENKLVVAGNVDNAVGNINFIGDVLVRGDVLNGFEVRAEGNITVNGMVEGAFLYAGKDVHIAKGMNGNKQGLIVAGGEVRCHFLENCTIHAIGNVQADSMVWCDITSDDSIIAGPGKGAIIGGSVMARNSITALVIGNKSHQKTNITLGYSNKVLHERETSEKDLNDAKNILDTLLKNINYLSKQKDLPNEKQDLLNQLIHQKRLYDVKKKALLSRLADLDNEISDFSNCHIHGDMIFPPTQVTIGNASRTISNVWFKCHVYYADGEIKFGTST